MKPRSSTSNRCRPCQRGYSEAPPQPTPVLARFILEFVPEQLQYLPEAGPRPGQARPGYSSAYLPTYIIHTVLPRPCTHNPLPIPSLLVGPHTCAPRTGQTRQGQASPAGLSLLFWYPPAYLHLHLHLHLHRCLLACHHPPTRRSDSAPFPAPIIAQSQHPAAHHPSMPARLDLRHLVRYHGLYKTFFIPNLERRLSASNT
ncbi:hypothetical protein LZ31DRAFT_166265 [Colletotrichum somersetense]|nr:hypothetical protein LZ31DRAFT_166265 [Colletotrichum somersetense]